MKCTLYAPNGQIVYHPRRDGQLEPAIWEGARIPLFLFNDYPNPGREWPYPNRNESAPFELDIDGKRHKVPLMYDHAVGSDILYLLLTLGVSLPAGPEDVKGS